MKLKIKIFNILVLLILCLNYNIYSQDFIVKGKIVDKSSKNFIEYVNIGILNKNIGTISKLDGTFILKAPNKFKNDSLTISHVSYYTIKIPVKNLKNNIIFLKPKIHEIK